MKRGVCMINFNKLTTTWKNSPEKVVRIVAFGSSNTELCWHSDGCNNWVDYLNMNLRTHIGRNVCVINQGICGQHTRDLLLRIDRDVFSFSPDLVIITIGGNDALWGFTDEEYYTNLKSICTQCMDRGIGPILQTYYCPTYFEGIDGFQDIFERFVGINRTLSNELDIPLMDQYRYFEPFYRSDPQGYKEVMRDWLHVNPLGNMIMGMNFSRLFELPDFTEPSTRIEKLHSTMAAMDGLYE